MIYLLSNSTEFRSIIVKFYLADNENIKNHSLTLVKISLLAQDLSPNTPTLFVTKSLPMLTIRSFLI